jgi:FixJ family two-component response regulator
MSAIDKLAEPAANSLRVYLVDDDALFRRAVSRLLHYAGFQVLAFASPAEFLSACPADADGCVVLDMAMPELTGLDIQQALAARKSSLPIVFLTGRADVPMTVQAMKHGAADFLTKPVNDSDLIAAVRTALEKGRIARQTRAELAEIQARLASLTPREREVLEHVVSGQLNKQIAGDLGTCEDTVKVHRGRVMRKMGVASVAELARIFERARSPASPG